MIWQFYGWMRLNSTDSSSFSKNTEMEFGIDKWAILVMKKGKIVLL